MGVGGYNRFVKNPETGEIEEWHEGYQSSAGHAMGLSPTPTYRIRIVPADEWAEIQRKNAEIDAERAREKAEYLAKEAEYQKWLQQLPDKIGWVTIDKNAGEATDSNGNYIVGLKRYNGMPPNAILVDINKNRMNYME